MDPSTLRSELEARGLVLLAVGQHRSNPKVLMVYLHGNQGQYAHGYALGLIKEVPGVLAVTESVATRTILLVRVQPDPGTGGD